MILEQSSPTLVYHYGVSGHQLRLPFVEPAAKLGLLDVRATIRNVGRRAAEDVAVTIHSKADVQYAKVQPPYEEIRPRVVDNKIVVINIPKLLVGLDAEIFVTVSEIPLALDITAPNRPFPVDLKDVKGLVPLSEIENFISEHNLVAWRWGRDATQPGRFLTWKDVLPPDAIPGTENANLYLRDDRQPAFLMTYHTDPIVTVEASCGNCSHEAEGLAQ